MQTRLNLSRRPFVNHRLFWIAVAIVLVASAWLALWVTEEIGRVRAEGDRVADSIRAQEGQVREYKEKVEAERKAEEQIVLTQQDAEQLAAARQLIAGKSLSWNKLIGDIENFVPKKARVVSIQVAETYVADGNSIALVEIKAAGQDPSQLTEMMESLEKSDGLFQLRTFNQGAILETGEVPFVLNLIYTPGRGGQL